MQIEIRNNQVVLDGYVSATGRDSRILPSHRGKFIEQIVPKTFERALSKANDIELLFNHKSDRKLGSIREGSLELYEDSIGLRAKAIVSDEEVIQKAKDGKLRGWSFGFSSNKDRWEDGKDNIQRRYLEDIDLYEVSILDKTPAYIATTINLESRDGMDVLTERRSEDAEVVVVKEEKFITDTEDVKENDEIIEEEETEQEKAEEVEKSKEAVRNKIAIYEQELELLKIKAKN